MSLKLIFDKIGVPVMQCASGMVVGKKFCTVWLDLADLDMELLGAVWMGAVTYSSLDIIQHLAPLAQHPYLHRALQMTVFGITALNFFNVYMGHQPMNFNSFFYRTRIKVWKCSRKVIGLFYILSIMKSQQSVKIVTLGTSITIGVLDHYKKLPEKVQSCWKKIFNRSWLGYSILGLGLLDHHLYLAKLLNIHTEFCKRFPLIFKQIG
jgi:hypothetical protein